MDKPIIQKECVEAKFESRYVKVYDLQYKKDAHYLDATRRDLDNLVAIKSDEEFRDMLPDAVTIALIVKSKDESNAPKSDCRLLLNYEYRYPAGRFLLSPPAGLLDPEDAVADEPLITAAKREVLEETGITIKDTDKVFVMNPLLFSSPGMTDESNAIVCAVVELDDLSVISQNGAVGTECFNGYQLIDEKEAQKLLRSGRDNNGNFYSIYTWVVLSYFCSGLWKS
ncbi:MAG: NUDIX hydrolase [Lachnospiraceae bacterium]|nr:NUDIX hydrolase [Candidatus Merdinaster equi]